MSLLPAVDRSPDPASPPAALALDRETARRIVADAAGRYVAARRAEIRPFVDRHFGLAGSLRLHRRALGWDVVRMPVNLGLAVPVLGVKAGAGMLRRLGAHAAADRIGNRRWFLQTAVAREVDWLIHAELLALPCARGERRVERDAFAEAVLADPRVVAAVAAVGEAVARRGYDPALRRQLESLLAAYTDTRAAAADIATALVALGTGAAALHKFTPSALSLGPAIAAGLAQSSAVAAFPLGTTLGGLWYATFPATASTTLVAGVTGGIIVAAAALSAFAGIVADPVQRGLGLHERRLHRLVGAVGQALGGDGTARMPAKDHYVARLLDLFELLRAAWRLARA